MTTPTVGDKYPYIGVWMTVEHVGKRRVRLRHVTPCGTTLTVWVTHRRWPEWVAARADDATAAKIEARFA